MSGSAYTVSSTLNIRGNYQQVMRQLGRSLSVLDNQIMATERNLVRLAGLFPRLAGVVNRSATAAATSMGTLRSAVVSTSGVVQGSTRSLNSQAAALNRTTRAIQQVTTAALSATAAMQALSRVPPPPRIPPPPRQPGGGGGSGRRSGGVGGVVSDRIRAAEGYLAGRASARGVWGMLSQAGEGQTLETLMRAQQIPPEQIARLRQEIPAWLERAPGANISDAMQAFSEARQAVGDDNGRNFGPAFEIAPMILRAARLSAVLGGRNTAGGLRPLARFMAIRGSFTDDQGNLNPQQGAGELRAMESALLAFTTAEGEGIDPRQWEEFAKQMGIAGRRISIEGIIGPMASLIQETNGQRAGTMLTAFSDQIVTGSIMKQSRERMGAMGLLQAPGQRGARQARNQEDALLRRLVAEGKMTEAEATTARQRSTTVLPAGSSPVIGRGLASVRGDLWLQEFFAAQAQKLWERQGNRGQAPEDFVLDQWDALKLRATDRRFGMSMLQTREVRSDISNAQRIEAARRAGADPAGQFLENSFGGALGNLTGSFVALLQEFGRSEAIIGLMNEMAKSLRDFGAAVRENPGFVDNVVKDLRQFLNDFRDFAASLANVVNTIDGVFRSFNGPTIGATVTGAVSEGLRVLRDKVRENTPEGVRDTVGSVNRTVDGVRDWFNGLPGRVFGPGQPAGASEAPPAGGGNPDAAPIPPSWGGPMPGSRGNIQLNSFQPIAPEQRDTVVQTVVNLDGRQIADVVTRHQGRAASGPTQGTDRWDWRRGPSGGETATA